MTHLSLTEGGTERGDYVSDTSTTLAEGRRRRPASRHAVCEAPPCHGHRIGVNTSARMVEGLGGRALAVPCDVTRGEDVQAALQKTIQAFGRLDAAFNNAGVEQPLTAAADVSEQEWDRIVAINLRGVFLCMKYEIPGSSTPA